MWCLSPVGLSRENLSLSDKSRSWVSAGTGQPQDCQKLSFSPQIRSTPPWEGPQRWTRVTEMVHAGAALCSLPGSAKAGSRARDELCVPAAGEELGARSRSRSLKPTSRPRALQSVRSPLTNTHTYSCTNPHNSRVLPFPADGSPKNLVSQSGEMCVTAQGHLPAVPVHSQDPAPYQVIPKDKVMLPVVPAISLSTGLLPSVCGLAAPSSLPYNSLGAPDPCPKYSPWIHFVMGGEGTGGAGSRWRIPVCPW